MRKVLSLFLIAPLAVAFALSSASAKADPKNDGAYNYLIVGLDEAAENADSIIVASFSPEDSRLSVMQIPRDTLCKYGGSYGKINRIFALLRSSGLDGKESMKKFSAVIEDALGLPLDGYLAMSSSTFSQYIDALGGVYITVPEGFPRELYPMELKLGENLLSGDEAIKFVRYREGLPTADLGRMDAQKLFIDGVYRTVTERLTPSFIFKVLGRGDISPIVKLSLNDAMSIVFRHFDTLKVSKFAIMTLPGVPAVRGGVSYYIANKPSAEHALANYFSLGDAGFDKNAILLDASDPDFTSVYQQNGLAYKLYFDGKSLEITP